MAKSKKETRDSAYLLALETSEQALGVALLDLARGEVAASFLSVSHRPSAERLVPAIDFLLRDLGADRRRIDAVAVNIGPGSFTGLRVGTMVAKTLAHQLSVPLLAVPSLVARAHAHMNGPLEPGWPAVVMADARRGQVFGGVYEGVGEEEPEREDGPDDNDALLKAVRGPHPAAAIPEAERPAAEDAEIAPWRTLLEPLNESPDTFLRRAVEAVGPRSAILCCSQDLMATLGDASHRVPAGWEFVPGRQPVRIAPDDVAAVGLQMLVAGWEADPAELEPDYVRPPDAKRPRIPQPE